MPLFPQCVAAEKPLVHVLAGCWLLQLEPSGAGLVTPTSGKVSSQAPLQLSSTLLHFSVSTDEETMSASAAWMSCWLLAKRAWNVPPATAMLLRSVRSCAALIDRPMAYTLFGFLALA